MRADIVAIVRLKSTAEGGRAGPTPSDKWSCLFVVADLTLDCRLLLTSIGSLKPGDVATVPIAFLSPELARQSVGVGTRFTLRESREVGEGEVLTVDYPNEAPSSPQIEHRSP